MAKIIKRGYGHSNNEIHWPVGEVVECSECDCRFLIEKDDPVERNEGKTDGTWDAGVDCPWCGEKAYLYSYE